MEPKKIILNEVKNRFLFISPSVEQGIEREAKITDFEKLEVLGSGSFGKVYLCRHLQTNATYALKCIDKTNKNNTLGMPYFRREIEIMYKLSHPNIVKLYGHFEDDLNIYFIMEYIPKGNLFTLLSKQKSKCFDSAKVANFMKDLISAIYYIHHLTPPIIHRDIKPENLLIGEDGSLKLTDFGWSNYMDYFQTRSTFCGTPLYLAPEIIKQTGHDESVDIWCIGALIFELLTGKCPFKGSSDNVVYDNILKNKIDWPKDINLEAKNLIGKILRTEAKDRISLAEMLMHPFFNRCFTDNNFADFLIKPIFNYDNDKNKDGKHVFVISTDIPQNVKNGNKNFNSKKDYVKLNNNIQNNNNNISNANANNNNNKYPYSSYESIYNNVITTTSTNLQNLNIDSANNNNNHKSNKEKEINTNIDHLLNNNNNANAYKSDYNNNYNYYNNYNNNNNPDTLSDVNSLKTQLKKNEEKLESILKEKEQWNLKEKILINEKETLIKEKEDQENQRHSLQLKNSELTYKTFEHEEKIKNLLNNISTLENKMEKDKNIIEGLQENIEELKKSKKDVTDFYIEKIEFLEENLKEATEQKENQMSKDVSNLRESIIAVKENKNFDIAKDFNFYETFEMLSKNFDEEREQFKYIVDMKQKEINKLKAEVNNFSQMQNFHNKNLNEKHSNEIRIKENEICYLNNKVKRLEIMFGIKEK